MKIDRMIRKCRGVRREQAVHLVGSSPPLLITETETLTEVFQPEIIRLRDGDKNLCSYEDTPETDAMRMKLSRWNDFSLSHWVDLLVSDQVFRTVVDRRSDEDKEEGKNGWGSDQNDRVVNLSRKRLHRVFNGSFEQGGRFYGGWWQGVPRAARPFITINGEPTRELDYAGLHLAMLYAKIGEPLHGDPYALDGIHHDHRKLIKITLMKMINAKKPRIALPRGMPLPPNVAWKDLQEAIALKHAAIATYFRSGEGLRLQRLDAEVAEDVMLSMMDRGVLALPIHDSFIVDYRHTEVLQREMLRAYRERLGAEIGIEADPSIIDDLGTASEDEVRNFLACESDPDYRGYTERKAAMYTGAPSDSGAWAEAA
jgi:hypothetical protein